MPDKKIISLLPSATEIVSALGMQKQLVGRSHECDHPNEIISIPECSFMRVDVDKDSFKINETIEQTIENGLSIFEINKQLIKDLKPDLIITQSQCEVCAISIHELEVSLTDWLDYPCEIISLCPNSLNDIFQDILTVSKVLEVEEKGFLLIDELKERLAIVKHKLKYVGQKPAVACIEWISPMMIAGNWMPELVQLAGGIPVLSNQGKHSSFVEFQQLVETNPDIIIIMPCGFPIQKTISDIHLLSTQDGWQDLKAVQNNCIFIADGNHYFNRPGPRIVDSVEILAEIINPSQFNFGYEGEGWIGFGN